MDDLKRLAAMAAINRTLRDQYWDVCALDRACDVMGIAAQQGGDAYKILRALHCVHYANMNERLRERIPELISEVLGIRPTFVFSTLDKQVIEVKPPSEPQKRKFLGITL